MTAWLGCHKFFWALNEVLSDEMSISYLEKEISAGVFCIHDEGEFFTAKCCVYSYGDPFDGFYYDDFNSIEDAIQEWCSKMGVISPLFAKLRTVFSLVAATQWFCEQYDKLRQSVRQPIQPKKSRGVKL